MNYNYNFTRHRYSINKWLAVHNVDTECRISSDICAGRKGYIVNSILSFNISPA